MDKPDDKKVDAIVQGKKKKRSSMTKFTDVFVEEDIATVKESILKDVIIPGAKEIIANTVTDTINMILFGGDARASGRSKSRSGNFVHYESMNRNNTISKSNKRRRTGYAYDDVVLESRGEAEEVIDNLYELLDVYGVVSIADLYDLAGLETRHTDNNYGWDDLTGTHITRLGRDEYMVKMPKPIQIN